MGGRLYTHNLTRVHGLFRRCKRDVGEICDELDLNDKGRLFWCRRESVWAVRQGPDFLRSSLKAMYLHFKPDTEGPWLSLCIAASKTALTRVPHEIRQIEPQQDQDISLDLRTCQQDASVLDDLVHDRGQFSQVDDGKRRGSFGFASRHERDRVGLDRSRDLFSLFSHPPEVLFHLLCSITHRWIHAPNDRRQWLNRRRDMLQRLDRNRLIANSMEKH
ncbi:hypothetical protein MRB53_041499 [Persea americana]|nr:hypothetical protein MRB53_041499 [Persea americana]